MLATSLNLRPATIDAGQSLSDAVDCGADFVVGLIMPTDWTPANVSVSISINNVEFFDLFSSSLAEVIFNVVPHVVVAIDPNTMLMGQYIKIRSGTRNEPVSQEATRVFTLITSTKVTSASEMEHRR